MYTLHEVTSVNKARKIIWAGCVVRMGGMINAWKSFVEKLLGERRWEDNIKMDLGGGGLQVMGGDWWGFRFSRRQVWRWPSSGMLRHVVS
jgi:hypothetical protein